MRTDSVGTENKGVLHMKAEGRNQQRQIRGQRLKVGIHFSSGVVLLAQACFVKGPLGISVL